MQKIKANMASVMGICMLTLSVLNIFISKLDLLYRPKSYVLFLVVFVLKDIRLLSGTLTSLRKEIWRGDWNEKPVLQWEDNANLLINGTSYHVKYILETK